MAVDKNVRESIQKSVGEFDANLDTFIQLNSSKVPAQKGVFSLVIGAGGTGLDALLETKGLINKTCCLDTSHRSLPTNNVRYLEFDTDSRSLTKVSSKQTGGAMLDPTEGEFVQMKSPNIAVFLGAAFRKQVPSYISSWLDFSIDPTHTGEDGAGGIRQCGRLLLFRNIDMIRSAIRSAIRNMVADQDVGVLNIYLLSGIAGGTGSGTFLDLAYIARDVAEEIAPAKVTMYGYLFLPDVNLSRPMPEDNVKYSKKNGYAALKELDYLMNLNRDGGRFVQRYSPNYVIDTELKPFNFVHLVSSKGAGGRELGDAYRDAMRAVAQSIVSFVAEEHREGVTTQFAITSHYSNIAQGVSQHKSTYPERSNSYLALGTFNYELPVDKLLLYVTSLLFKKMDKMFFQDPTAAEIDKAYHALGLTPRVLISYLAGDAANLAPQGVTWEQLFGKNPLYNLVGMSNSRTNQVRQAVQVRAQNFLADFPEKFTRLTEGWIKDPERGPIWVNHLVTMNSGNQVGLDARLSMDMDRAGQQITRLKGDINNLRQRINAYAIEARDAGAIFGRREEKVREYIDLINQEADMSAQLAAMIELEKLYPACQQSIRARNNVIFSVIVEVLVGLKDICEKNAEILTETRMNEDRTHFTWQPISVPDVSDSIKRVFDAKGDADETINRFCTALYEKACQWAANSINVKSFIRDYLDTNLSDIAGRSLENYIMDLLHGDSLFDSVSNDLGPKATGSSVPLIALTQNADTGGKFWLLSVPYSCPNILAAFEQYKTRDPNLAATLTIQPTGIKDRIFAQSVLGAVPLSAYYYLADYEDTYLTPYGNSGRHLYMGKDENWEDLPSPIPRRSRPDKEGTYPRSIQVVEDKLRELFRQCRALPIIRCVENSNGKTYTLYLCELPDLEAQFAREKMQDERGRLDPLKAEEAIEVLNRWLREGLKTTGTYQVADCAAPADNEPDTSEETAQECFLGEYNNIRRARVELEKYQKVREKLSELQETFQQTVGIKEKARQTVQLLISGTVKMMRTETGDSFYNSMLGDRERRLVEITEHRGYREAVLSRTMTALSEDEEPMKRDLYDKLVANAQAVYKKMDADLESAEGKKNKLQSLRKGVAERYTRLKEDIMDGLMDGDDVREMLVFYEELKKQLDLELRRVEDKIKEWTSVSSGVEEEF